MTRIIYIIFTSIVGLSFSAQAQISKEMDAYLNFAKEHPITPWPYCSFVQVTQVYSSLQAKFAEVPNSNPKKYVLQTPLTEAQVLSAAKQHCDKIKVVAGTGTASGSSGTAATGFVPAIQAVTGIKTFQPCDEKRQAAGECSGTIGQTNKEIKRVEIKEVKPVVPENVNPTVEFGKTKGFETTTTQTEHGKTIVVKDAAGNSLIQTFDKEGKLLSEEGTDVNNKSVSTKDLPKELREYDKVEKKIADVTGDKKEEISEAAKERAAKAADIETQKYTDLEQKRQAIKDKADAYCDNSVKFNTSCQAVKATLGRMETDIKDAEAEQQKCVSTSSKANFLCPIATSPHVQTAGILMNGLAAVIPSIGSAKDTCSVTSKTNLVGQSIIGVGTVVCGTYKGRCENKCGDTNAKLESINRKLDEISADLKTAHTDAEQKKADARADAENARIDAADFRKEAQAARQRAANYRAQVPSGEVAAAAEDAVAEQKDAEAEKQDRLAEKKDAEAKEYARISKDVQDGSKEIEPTKTKITGKTAENTAVIAQCEKYKVELAQMATTTANMVAAAAQAKQCENQLSALNSSSGNSPQTLTMDEMCSQPQNASSTVCKCRTDNTAVGCPGYIAASGSEGNLNKDINFKGTSNMAGFSAKSKLNPTGGSSSSSLGDLSDEAKKALSAGSDKTATADMFGSSSAAGAGGGAGVATASGGKTAGVDKSKLAEEPKSFGSSVMNAVGSLFGKGSSSTKPVDKNDKLAADKYQEKIKRQIASEQARSEISSASGTDNWTKIKTRYKSNMSSLIESN